MSEKELVNAKFAIAKFMGKTVYPEQIPAKNKRGWKYSYKWNGEFCDYSQHQLNYDTDWSMLMPVVEKICRTKEDGIEPFYLRTFGMIDNTAGGTDIMVRFNRFSLHSDISLLTATFKAVCEFTKDYRP